MQPTTPLESQEGNNTANRISSRIGAVRFGDGGGRHHGGLRHLHCQRGDFAAGGQCGLAAGGLGHHRVLTLAGALSYGELAAMMPEAGGMYVYLREAFSPLLGFLYGWTLLTVIQTGTIAAVGIAFARFSGILFPSIREDRYLIAPVHVSAWICALAVDRTAPGDRDHRSHHGVQ